MKNWSRTDYHYHLPDERIARFPLQERDSSRLLVADVNDQSLEHSQVHDLLRHLPKNCIIVLNNSKVIPARIHMMKESGAAIELLLLEPANDISANQSLQSNSPVRWNCMIGGKKVVEGMQLINSQSNHALRAVVVSRHEKQGVIEFQWDEEIVFADILHAIGKAPLPPYMHREAEELDNERYQTVFAREDGSVAAPTAGLHLSEGLLNDFRSAGHTVLELTLHVGLGTFSPMNADDIRDHDMHLEKASFDRPFIEALLSQLRSGNDNVLCIGTTSLRCLESMYWLAYSLNGNDVQVLPRELLVDQWVWTSQTKQLSAIDALDVLLSYMQTHELERLNFSTRLMIGPGYSFQLCRHLLTNFHQPDSTLLVLVSAFCGIDFRRKLYDEALAQDYRFLSYGDAMLLLR